MASNPFRRFELAPANSNAGVRTIAAVSRIPGSMEIWWIAPNGSVQAAYWYEGQDGWRRYELAPAGSASTDGGVAAVSRIPTSMEVWWVGRDGSVQAAFWYDGGQWGRYQLAPAGSASVHGGIKAVSRIPTSMEVWWVGPDGSVQDAYWYDGGQWGRFALAPAGSAAPSAGVAAVSRVHNSMEVWWVGRDGSVQDAYWYEGQDGWRRFALAPAGSASPNSGVAAVSRIPTSMEVWWVGPDGSVQDAYWYEGQDGWRRYELAPAGSAAPIGGIAAVSRIPASMEVWWVGGNGSVQDAYWYEGANGPFEFNAPIVSGGLAALGGWMKVTINPDGSVRWQGHAHDSGADGYDFGVSAVVRAPSGRAVAVAHSGHVGGTFTSGSRDHDWDVTQPPNPVLAANIADFAGARIEPNIEYSSDIGSALEKAVSWLIKFGVGTVLTPVGVVAFVGVEVGSLISTGSLVPGARVVEGVLWMAGPANTVFAIIAEGIAELGSRTRELTQEEYDWANNEVFAGSLPPRDRLVLTDTIGPGNPRRAFTFPRFDGKFTLNMGPDAFADPRNYPGRARGQTFIHELVHACQMQHATIDLSLLADAFASKVCEATGGNPYAYGPAGPDYSSFNLEQQAQIVSDWFAGAVPPGSNQTGVPKDINSPYFRYITGNVRVGRF
jgi:hypothetical protein